MLSCQRSLFDIPHDVAYLNCAYMSSLMNSVVRAGEEAVRGKSQPWGTTSQDFFTQSEHTRALFGELIGGGADDIAIVPSASYGIAVAAAIGRKTRNANLRAPHFLGVRFPDGIPENLLKKLANKNVYVSIRGSSLRVTPHLYNTDDDIDRLFTALDACL